MGSAGFEPATSAMSRRRHKRGDDKVLAVTAAGEVVPSL